MSEIIKIENLIFEYPADEGQEPKRAIDGVSLEIEKGSFTSIIGQNGSGKSTLAKNLNGLLLPTGGAVYVKGWNTLEEEHIWDIRQTAGMVFQNPDNQLVSSIVEDDVAFGPENIGVDPREIRERVDKALEDVRMGDYKRKAPHLLSGGQKQRIAIAGTIAMKPECIIFDEPTAMLDPSGREDIMKIIHQLNDEGITIVLITHFMEEAVQGDRIIIMDKGQVLLDGSPQEVFSQGETIRDHSLEVPMAVEITDYLRARGLDIPRDIVTTEALQEFICQSK
ncbi:MAG: energy-coupling factor transporter ATPase [Firmicutes bacterium]|nr:energy-coupling factor transporter ATPase [Bacillota bacterium]